MLSVKHTIDLHCHTTASDGKLTPSDLIALALREGLQILAITDHDTLAGAEAVVSGSAGGYSASTSEPFSALTLIQGVELSCSWRGVNVHVLAYAREWGGGGMQLLIGRQRERRWQRAEIISRRLEKALGTDNLFDRVRAVAPDADVPGRPHFAACLLGEGRVESMDDAFDRYLGAGKIGDVKMCWPSLDELIGEARSAGAILSLAHPMHYKLTATKLRELLDAFHQQGGHCIEIAVPGIDSGHYGWLVNEARRRTMGQSFGSDYHGWGNIHRNLGRYPKVAEGIPSILEWLDMPQPAAKPG
ncbi:MAG: PHP domain-containing protein [Hahellaceae bacterium]|nr:PHP domain-containing protein [Hahellaceae bacterium]